MCLVHMKQTSASTCHVRGFQSTQLRGVWRGNTELVPRRYLTATAVRTWWHHERYTQRRNFTLSTLYKWNMDGAVPAEETRKGTQMLLGICTQFRKNRCF